MRASVKTRFFWWGLNCGFPGLKPLFLHQSGFFHALPGTIPVMPPRVAKKASGGSSGPGKRTVSRTAKAAADKVAEEIPVVDLEEVKVQVDVVESVLEPERDANGSIGISRSSFVFVQCAFFV